MTPAFWRLWLLTCQHERPTLAAQLAECNRQLWASERRRARAEGQLDHYIGQAIRARAERDETQGFLNRAHADFMVVVAQRDRAQACLAQAVVEKADLERSNVLLTEIAERLRDELRELRAGLAVGALTKKGRH